jgi:hypothetical protein
MTETFQSMQPTPGVPRLAAGAVKARAASLSQAPITMRKSALLLDHWLDIAGADLVPHRDLLDPTRIAYALPNVVIHQVETAERVTIRLAGTAFYDVYGRELTGTNYLDLVAPERRAQAYGRLRAVVDHPCALFTELIYASKAGVFGRAESLGLPLVGRNGTVDTIIYVNERLPIEPDPYRPAPEIETVDTLQAVFLDVGAGVPANPDAAVARGGGDATTRKE